MSSKPRLTDAPKPSLTLTEMIERTLVTHEYNDVTGVLPVNVTDGLFAIANAINRLANIQERLATEQRAAMDSIIANYGPGGHA